MEQEQGHNVLLFLSFRPELIQIFKWSCVLPSQSASAKNAFRQIVSQYSLGKDKQTQIFPTVL